MASESLIRFLSCNFRATLKTVLRTPTRYPCWSRRAIVYSLCVEVLLQFSKNNFYPETTVLWKIIYFFYTHQQRISEYSVHRYLERTPACPVSIFCVIVLFAFTWLAVAWKLCECSVGKLMNCWQASSFGLLLNDDGNNFYYSITVAGSTQIRELMET